MKKTTVLTLGVVLILGMLPAMAQLNIPLNTDEDNENDLGKIWTDFQTYAQDLQYYLKSSLPQKLQPIQKDDINNAIERSSAGDLNIPDPFIAAQEIDNVVITKSNNTAPDPFENNLSLRAALDSNELNRELIRGSVQGVLGTLGQTRLKTKLDSTQQAIEEIAKRIKQTKDNQNFLNDLLVKACEAANQTTANAATSATQCASALTTNTQVEMLKIQGEQVKIQAETFAQTIQMNQLQQYSNLNLANVSQQIEEANRARRVDSSAETARLLRATSQINLLVTPKTPNQ